MPTRSPPLCFVAALCFQPLLFPARPLFFFLHLLRLFFLFLGGVRRLRSPAALHFATDSRVPAMHGTAQVPHAMDVRRQRQLQPLAPLKGVGWHMGREVEEEEEERV